MKHERERLPEPQRTGAHEHEHQPSNPTSSRAARSGTPLPSAILATMEERFHHRFDDVRIHADAAADLVAREHRARAVTVDSDIYFRGSAFRPDTLGGAHLVAHELAHVIQQSGVEGQATDQRPERGERGDAFEVAARGAADAIVLGAHPQAGAIATGAVPTAQCEDEDDGLITGLFGNGPIAGGAQGAWNAWTDDFIGGVMDVADFGGDLGKFAGEGGVMGGLGTVANLGGGLGGDIMKGLGKAGDWLSPLSIIQGSADVTESLMSDESNFENTEKGVLGALNVFSGGTSLAGLMGALPEIGGAMALGEVGAMGAGGLLAAGGEVASAGLAGYAAGRGLDNAVDWIGDEISGNEGADHSISGFGADVMTSIDQGATGLLRDVGVLDESAPEYTQTLGWQLAEILPSWMQ